MSKFKTLALAGAAAIALAATPASAAELLYSFSSLSGTDDFSFTLDSNPTPDGASDFAFFFFSSVPVTTPTGAETTQLAFFQFGEGGGLGFATPSLNFLGSGPQLYSSPEASPTMLTGVFELNGNTPGTLIVTEVNAAVPEPGTWAMMLLGFGAMGWSFKRRRKLALA